MNQYAITFSGSAKKELGELPSDIIDRILIRIRELTIDALPVGCKKLHGYKDRWRVRIGNYRVVYAIDDSSRTVDISRIAHRKDVYE